MPYKRSDWMKRISERTDISSQLVHLTRETEELSSIEVLYKIISEGKLTGSSTKSGFICGSTPAVCFQDTPLVSICQNVYYEQKYNRANKIEKHRYKAVGLSIAKDYAYHKKARPVVYDKTEAAKKYLPKDEWWRIVNFDLSNKDAFIDWTHEREWRAPGNFEFEINHLTLLFVNQKAYKAFFELCEKENTDFLSQVNGIVVMSNLLY